MSNIRTRRFTVLPEDTTSFYTVIAWTRTANPLTGHYRQRILTVVHKSSVLSSFEVDGKDELRSFELNLGSLKFFSPGTRFFDQKVDQFAHEYKQTYCIKIDNPENLLPTTLGVVTGISTHSFVHQEDRYHITGEQAGPLNSLPVITLPGFDHYEKVVIPCSVIADYYYYGSPKMIEYLLECKVDRSNRMNNRIYDPVLTEMMELATGKKLAMVRLEKEMWDEDAVRIARLALDEHYWNSCISMASGLIKQTKPYFLQTIFPIRTATELKFYGIKLNVHGKTYLLAQMIVMCTAKLPFDGLVLTRDNPGRLPTAIVNDENHQNDNGASSQGGENNEKEAEDGQKNENKNPLASGAGEKEDQVEKDNKPSGLIAVRIGAENSENPAPVGEGSAGYNNMDRDWRYESPQQMNFPDENILKEEALVFGEPQGNQPSNTQQFLIQFGAAIEFTTELSKKGDRRIFRVHLKGSTLRKPVDTPAVECFKVLEDVFHTINRDIKKSPDHIISSTTVKCPLPYGDYEIYSRFPAEKFEPPDDNTKAAMKFCYISGRKNRYSIYKRIFIQEILAKDYCFYVMDIQPKGNRQGRVGMLSKTAVILSLEGNKLSDDELAGLLVRIAENEGSWKFLSEKYSRKLLRHVKSHQNIADRITEFIKKKIIVFNSNTGSRNSSPIDQNSVQTPGIEQ